MIFQNLKLELKIQIWKHKTWFSFIKTLEKSKYLETLINRVKINTEFSETPKNNSKIKPENFALGLPAFFSQSIGTINKPVIFDY